MRVLCFLFLAVALVACSNSSAVPDDIIPGKKMEIILWQLIQSDEYVNKLLAKDSLKKNSTERVKIYQQVFDLNGNTMSEFKKSYQFYMAHPDITKVMFDSIYARAERQRTETYGPKHAFPVKSLKPAPKPKT